MQIRTFLVGALVLVPAAIARADGCPRSNPMPNNPAPTAPAAPTASATLGSHGGALVVLGNAGNPFEVVHDASIGKVTVYSVESPSRTIVVAQPPMIALDGRRELTLVPVSGETNVWAVTDDSLRGGNLTGRLMVRTNDRWETAALTTPASTRAVANPAAAVPTAWNEPLAAHGGRVLAACGGSFEWVRDAATGKATLFMLTQGDKKATLDADPVLSIRSAAGDARTLSMTSVPGTQGAWEVTVDVFKGDAPADGTVKVSVDGKPCELNLRDAAPANGNTVGGALPKANDVPAGDLNQPAPAPAQPEAPKNAEEPRDNAKDNAKNDTSAQPATTALVFGGGIAKLELRRDAGLGRVTLTTPADVRAARLDGAPVLVLETPAGKKELTFEKGADEGTWTVTSEELKATTPLKGVVRIAIEGKQLEADAAPQFADVKPTTPSEMR